MATKVTGSLETVVLLHKPTSLLINKGNCCYINSTLLTLVASSRLPSDVSPNEVHSSELKGANALFSE
jgi:ubiquitin C-terminal hydrolase